MNISTSQKKKKKKKHANTWNITIFCTSKEKKKEKRIIRDKVEIKNADMKIIKWLQQFHNKSYAISCYWWVKHVNIKPKLELEPAYHIRFIMKILWMKHYYYFY